MFKLSQSKGLSLQESLNGAAIGAPTAIGLHKFFLWAFPMCVDIHDPCNDVFVVGAWFAFFLHSVGWRYVTRRVYENYGLQLNVVTLIKSGLRKICHAIQ